jgi:hypothetical protein
LGAELDIVLVHKLGYPGQPELAIGAIDEKGNLFAGDYLLDIDPEYLKLEKERQLEVLRQRRARYTPGHLPIDPKDRIVIVVDDGIATGATMTVALRAIRRQSPKKLIAAVAIASPMAARAMSDEADAIFTRWDSFSRISHRSRMMMWLRCYGGTIPKSQRAVRSNSFKHSANAAARWTSSCGTNVAKKVAEEKSVARKT